MTDYDVLKEKYDEAFHSQESSKAEYQTLISNYENEIDENNKNIASLKETIKNNSESVRTSHVRIKKNNEDIFHIKPKKKGNSKSTDVDALKYEYPECDNNDNVDLIKCNVCGKWVCEECNDIAISKVKPIMNKCHTLYFVCKGCDKMLLDSTVSRDLSTSEVEEERQNHVEKKENSDLLKSLQTMFDTKIIQIESKLEELIDNKLDKKMDEINTLSENFKEQAHASVITTLEKRTYSDALQDPKDFRQILQQTRNEERVEEREKEKRSKNFIIHGLAEEGDDSAVIKDNDTKIIARFLEKMGIESEPESFSRLGKPNEGKKRTLKIVMKTNHEKEKVLGNLNGLKNTVEEFGRISVTDDYTINEREEIKSWIKKAEEKSAQDPEQVYKVRGNPKNGLRLVSFARR